MLWAGPHPEGRRAQVPHHLPLPAEQGGRGGHLPRGRAPALLRQQRGALLRGHLHRAPAQHEGARGRAAGQLGILALMTMGSFTKGTLNFPAGNTDEMCMWLDYTYTPTLNPMLYVIGFWPRNTSPCELQIASGNSMGESTLDGATNAHEPSTPSEAQAFGTDGSDARALGTAS